MRLPSLPQLRVEQVPHVEARDVAGETLAAAVDLVVDAELYPVNAAVSDATMSATASVVTRPSAATSAT